MNRTVKVTGFSLKPAVRHLLCDLFSRVAQVDKVYLSPDKNAAFVRLADKSSLQFVLEQDWELQCERLKVQRAVPQTTSTSSSCLLKDTNHDSNTLWNRTNAAVHSDCVLDNRTSCTNFTHEDYISGFSQFWADVPHQTFTPVCKKKKRRNSDVRCCVMSGQKKCHRPKKRKRKKPKAFLESAPSVPFGIECSFTVGDAEAESCEPHNCREIFIKGSETMVASLPLLSTAKEACDLVAEVSKVPSDLLNITVEGRALTEEVVHSIRTGATLHYSVKGIGGADHKPDDLTSEQQRKVEADELKKRGNKVYEMKKYEDAVFYYSASIAMFPTVAAFNNRAQSYLYLLKWEECIRDCNEVLRLEPMNLKAFLRRGRAFKEKGDFELAQADLKIVINKDSAHLAETAKSYLQEVEKELSQESTKDSTMKKVTAQRMAESPEATTKSARKRQRKKLKSNKQSCSPQLDPDTSEKAVVKKDCSLDQTIAGTVSTEPANDGQLSCSVEAHCVNVEQAVNTDPCRGTTPASLQTVQQEIHPASSAQDTMLWLQRICGLTGECLNNFEDLDGKMLFAYKHDVKKLAEHTEVPLGVARKIVFFRDYPHFQSAMLGWNVEHVQEFIEKNVQGQNLSKLHENKIDGPAFLSYQNEGEIQQDLNVKKLIAFKILIERNSFLDEERVNSSQDENERTGETTATEQEAGGSSQEKETNEMIVEDTAEGKPATAMDSIETGHSGDDAMSVLLKKEDVFTAYKLFLQNSLHLQPVTPETSSNKLKECGLHVIYHKRRDLNKLEEQFIFFIMGKPDFCRGKQGKDAYTKLWKMVKGEMSAKWLKLLPDETRELFLSEDDSDRIQHDYKTISFGDETAKILSITEFDKTVRGLDKFTAPVLLLDKQLLEEGCCGYYFNLKQDKTTDAFCFRFHRSVPYWIFDSQDFGWGFRTENIEGSVAGNLPKCQYTVAELPRSEASANSPAEESHLQERSENSDKTSCNEQKFGADSNTVNAVDVSKMEADTSYPQQETVESEEETDLKTQVVENAQFSVHAPEPAVFVPSRPFKKNSWKYGEGILRAIESGDNMLSPAVELKYQASCHAEAPLSMRSFLYKALEFVCACLNARKNGTIYFGVAEKSVGEKTFRYGEIIGIEMDQALCAHYYDTIYNNFLQKCFPDYYELVKLCVSGPYFIPIRNTNTRYVIEIDIEPNSQQTKDHVFEFCPAPIFEKYGEPKKSENDFPGRKKEKHVYMKNKDKWSGLFRRDGSESKYVDTTEKHHFVRTILPELCTKRRQEEQKDLVMKSQLMSTPEAEKLKQFMGECDASMFPILVLPKVSESDRPNISYFGFLHHIRWSAVFDFDNRSDKDGVYSIAISTNLDFEVHESVVSDFVDLSVDDRKDQLSFPKKTVWLFANGKTTGSNAFERLERKAWKNSYWTYIQNAVAFYKDNSVIPPSRRLVLILVSDELDDGIVEASQDIKTAFTWNTVFFVFSSDSVRDQFAEELSDDVYSHSVVMPWQHVHHVMCQCLNLKGRDREKYVCASSGAHVPIPPNEWQSWGDLEVLNSRECLEEWDGLSKTQRDAKAYDEERQFYRGNPVSWWNFFFTCFAYDHVMKRSNLPKVLSHIDDKIRITDGEVDKVPIVTISHMPGAGGTTLGRNILWEMKNRHKCAVIKTISSDTERQVTQFWEAAETGQDQMRLQPVVLLADNLTSDSSLLNEFELCRKLYRRQKELQLSRPLAILIHCNRNMKPEGKFQLTQKLAPEEKAWMEKKSKDLEKQNIEDVETFIAFLSMRHEFDQEFLQNTIIQFLDRKVLYENERMLIEFISLITAYFPLSEGSPGLPVTSCDALMRKYGDDIAKKLPWEKTLSKVAKVLLIVEYRYDSNSPRTVVRIANQPYAKVILDTVLKENNETLGDIVLRCLESPLVSNVSPSCKEVTEMMSKMLIERHFDEDSTQMTLMSPLIMDIKRKEFEKALQVLKTGYKRLKNEVFNQQIARLYMSENQLDEAKEFAQLAVQLSPEKRDFKHTLGLVHLKRFSALIEKVQGQKKMSGINKIEEHLKVAFLALTNFIEAQGKIDDDALSICYAHCQTIEVVNKVLHFLLDQIPEDDLFKLGRYLTEDDYLDYDLFDQLLAQERETLKALLMHGIKALCFLFYLAYSYSSGRNGVSYQDIRDTRTLEYVTTVCVKQMSMLATSVGKLRIQTRFTSKYENRPKEDNARRFRNVKLKGCFFESIFYQFKYLRGRRQQWSHTRESFQEIRNNLDAIVEKSFTDMDNFMTISLAIQIADEGKTFTHDRSSIYKMCDRIIRSDLEPHDTRRMRAHLYRVFVSWPQEHWEGFNEDEFRKSFQQRSPILMHRKESLLPKVHFFVTNETKEFYLCHWTDIYGDVEREAPWAEMCKLLKSFTGNYKVVKKRDGEQFSRIEMDWKCAAGELHLTIWKIRGLKVFREERVEFYLGFSLHGPVAFIHNVLPDSISTVDCN